MQTAEAFLNKAKGFFSEDAPNLFSNQKIDQLIKQVEIDVLGAVWDSDGKFKKIIAGDIAHHSKGVNYYKGKSEVKVISKMLRALAAIYVYWGEVDVELFFAAPRVYPTPREKIQDRVDKLIDFIAANKLKEMNIDINLYLQESFREEIKDKIHTVINNNDYTNSAELYMRAYQLCVDGQDSLGNVSKRNNVENEEAIGKFVCSKLVDFLTNSEDELLEKMCSLEQTKKANLGLPCSLLMKEEKYKREPKLKNRYYRSFTIDKNSSSYRLCNHWYSKNEKTLKEWMRDNGWEEDKPKE